MFRENASKPQSNAIAASVAFQFSFLFVHLIAEFSRIRALAKKVCWGNDEKHFG